MLQVLQVLEITLLTPISGSGGKKKFGGLLRILANIFPYREIFDFSILIKKNLHKKTIKKTNPKIIQKASKKSYKLSIKIKTQFQSINPTPNPFQIINLYFMRYHRDRTPLNNKSLSKRFSLT